MNENFEHTWCIIERSYNSTHRRMIIRKNPAGYFWENYSGILSVIQYLKKTGATRWLYGNTSHDSLNISCSAKYTHKKNVIVVNNEKKGALTFCFHSKNPQKVVMKKEVPEDDFEETLEHYLKLLESNTND